MKNNGKKNWWVDMLLFAGFLAVFFMDWTGLALHQWIGLFGGILAAYHLLAHWNWVSAVTRRLAGWFAVDGRAVSGKGLVQARLYYSLDAALLIGFIALLVSGLLMSSWLDLELLDYASWRLGHVLVAILALVLTFVKLGLHWRWIAATTRQLFAPLPKALSSFQPGNRQGSASAALATRPAAACRGVSRREFLQVIGVVGFASAVAISQALDDLPVAQATASSQTDTSLQAQSGDQSGAASQSVASQSETCSVQCPRRCSYPGHCRRYTDANGNNRCDWGECG